MMAAVQMRVEKAIRCKELAAVVTLQSISISQIAVLMTGQIASHPKASARAATLLQLLDRGKGALETLVLLGALIVLLQQRVVFLRTSRGSAELSLNSPAPRPVFDLQARCLCAVPARPAPPGG